MIRRALAIALPALALGASAAAGAVVFGGDVAGSYRARPSFIHLTSDQNIRSIKWSTWGGRTARGTGTIVFSVSDRLPPAPLRLRLTRVRRCGRRAQYTSLVATYVRTPPPGGGHSFSVRYGCRSPF